MERGRDVENREPHSAGDRVDALPDSKRTVVIHPTAPALVQRLGYVALLALFDMH